MIEPDLEPCKIQPQKDLKVTGMKERCTWEGCDHSATVVDKRSLSDGIWNKLAVVELSLCDTSAWPFTAHYCVSNQNRPVWLLFIFTHSQPWQSFGSFSHHAALNTPTLSSICKDPTFIRQTEHHHCIYPHTQVYNMSLRTFTDIKMHLCGHVFISGDVET